MPVYVIQTSGGYEQRVCESIKQNISNDIVKECFVPLSERPYHVKGGEWTRVLRPLFPGYVFVETDDPAALEATLVGLPCFVRMLSAGERLVPLSDDEMAWLRAVTNNGTNTAGMSCGVIKQGQLIVLSGPLVGRSAQVRKIDRHKRMAWVEVEMFGRTNIVKLGLEITQKIA